MRRTCICGEEFEAKRPTAKYCGDRCRKRAQRGTNTSNTTSTVVAFGLAPRPPRGEPEPGPLEAAAHAELESFGRADTLAGGVVLALARRIDGAGPMDTGSGFAALAKELRASMAVALAGADQESDPIDQVRDEVRQQRESKQHGRGAR
ncbi:hypothetical protein [Streptomyces sp. NPDC101455]|uniref:hypothetical protein n=1 Tax=Streptomyces sp. NPDC101455 TaxID=3366142 RepID=UPI00380E980E